MPSIELSGVSHQMLRSLAVGAKLGSMTTAYEVGRIPVITVAHRLRIAREASGLDQGQLATLIGISRTSVSNAEVGKHEPRRILLNAWALATGVPVSWLETGAEQQSPHPSDPDGGEAVEPPEVIETSTFSLRVKCSTD